MACNRSVYHRRPRALLNTSLCLPRYAHPPFDLWLLPSVAACVFSLLELWWPSSSYPAFPSLPQTLLLHAGEFLIISEKKANRTSVNDGHFCCQAGISRVLSGIGESSRFVGGFPCLSLGAGPRTTCSAKKMKRKDTGAAAARPGKRLACDWEQKASQHVIKMVISLLVNCAMEYVKEVLRFCICWETTRKPPAILPLHRHSEQRIVARHIPKLLVYTVSSNLGQFCAFWTVLFWGLAPLATSSWLEPRFKL